MDVAGSCFHNDKNFRKQSRTSFAVSAFSDSGSILRKGGRQREQPWVGKSRNICPCPWIYSSRLNSNDGYKLSVMSLESILLQYKRNSSTTLLQSLCFSHPAPATLLQPPCFSHPASVTLLQLLHFSLHTHVVHGCLCHIQIHKEIFHLVRRVHPRQGTGRDPHP